MKTIVLGGGCFWCTEAVYQRVKGVEKVVSGYAGGGTGTDPSYWDLHTGAHGHAEVIEVTYDPAILPLETVFEIFFATHDPTTTNQPGTADMGQEYRSIILCAEDELEIAREAKNNAQRSWDRPIITEIVVLDEFHEAEAGHQNFYNENQGVGYCQVIINPKLEKFRKNFAHLLKED